MHYVWKHRLWLAGDLRSIDHQPIQVIDTGQLNHDAGPDFFNAKVNIGGKCWCGNVEMHLRASDWYRHGHQEDPAYNSVILHVVHLSDCRVTRTDGQIIPQMILPCAADFAEKYSHFINNPANELCCAPHLHSLPPVMVHSWLDALAFQRLYAKAEAVRTRADRYAGHWEQAVFITLARALGAGINGDAFERVAASLPLRLLHKHSDSIVSLEAFLFGQAGLLEGTPPDPYVEHLQQEYQFLRNKFSLQPLNNLLWQMARMRPQSFPHRRLALLAAMCLNGFDLLQRIRDCATEADARQLFSLHLSGYWTTHYSFGRPSAAINTTALSRSTIDILVINVVLPVMMAYGEWIGDEQMMARATALGEFIPPEKNRYTARFTAAGVACNNALTSQAMVQLHTQYCNLRKCLQCRIGHRLLASQSLSR